jgi:NAD(P)-dependent dehydrogenase (short-subunit alcohol dehydrogenase family)
MQNLLSESHLVSAEFHGGSPATKKIWVIGGTSGIGAAVYQAALDSERYEVGWATGKDVDITRPGKISQFLFDHEQFNHIVFCAGVNYLHRIEDLSVAESRYIMEVNYQGFINVLRALWYHQEPGLAPPRVVAVGSDAATRPMRTSLAYCASKAALDMAVRCAAREWGPAGWRINAVAPGMTSGTEMTDYIDRRVPEVRGWTPDQAAEYEMLQAVIKRRAHPSEIAQVVLDVLNGPDYLNGSIVTVNGGR